MSKKTTTKAAPAAKPGKPTLKQQLADLDRITKQPRPSGGGSYELKDGKLEQKRKPTEPQKGGK